MYYINQLNQKPIMGKFTEVDIVADFATNEIAETVAETLIDDVTAFIVESLKDNDEKDFYLNITDVDVDDTSINIKLNSSRTANAEWQSEMILKTLKEKHINELDSFNAERVVPESFIYYERED